MSRPTQEKCQQCANLTAQEAQEKHGPDGDACWNPSVCYRRRSHYRNRQQNNQKRQKHHHWKSIQLTLSSFLTQQQPQPQNLIAFLYLYVSEYQNDKDLHAIGLALWQGQTLQVEPSFIHCLGINSQELKACMVETLKGLDKRFGVTKFNYLVELDASDCPLRPCPFHPEHNL